MKDPEKSEAIVCNVDEAQVARIRFLSEPIHENEDEINVFVPRYRTVIDVELVEVPQDEKDESQ